jgi:hypothetical protein
VPSLEAGDSGVSSLASAASGIGMGTGTPPVQARPPLGRPGTQGKPSKPGKAGKPSKQGTKPLPGDFVDPWSK